MSELTQETLRTMIDTNEANLQLITDQLHQLNEDSRKIQTEQARLQRELLEVELPWKVGYIVEDETGTRYRVTDLGFKRYGTDDELPRPEGIRLTKAGAEAYKDPRRIYSNQLLVIPEPLIVGDTT